VVDPICLGVKIVDKGKTGSCCSAESIPEHIHNCVRGQIAEGGEKELVCTLGIFAIIRLERPTQIAVPCSDFYVPEKSAPIGGEEDDPYKLFKKMKFPMSEFFPQPLSNTNFSDENGDKQNGKR